jgi:uncharacterized membrane protein YcgQ (UPF0703/DUF1980 family)
MASTLKINTLTGVTTAGSIAVTGEGNSTTTNLQQGLAKSWITFKSDSTFINRDSFNVSSLADGGAGFGTMTMTSAMSTGHHTVHSTSSDENSHSSSEASNHTTTVYQSFSKNSSHSLTDTAAQYATVYGDLA